jgi:hypothetical protein
MRGIGLLASVSLALLLVAWQPVRAGEPVREVWRSRYGGTGLFPNTRHVAAVNPTDSTVWLVEGANVTHLAPDGTLLFRSAPLYAPSGLAVDPKNGSCWVMQGNSDELLHFTADGVMLSATPGFTGYTASLTPSPADGSLWVTGYGYVAHVNAAGQQTYRANAISFPIVADPTDGSAWLSDVVNQTLVRLRGDNFEIWRLSGIADGLAAGENIHDQSVWVAADTLMHVSAGGTVLWQGVASSGVGVTGIYVVGDGSVLVWYNMPPHGGSPGVMKLVRLDSSGNEMWSLPNALAAYDSADDSFWLFESDAQGPALVQFSAANQELRKISIAASALVLAYEPTSNSFWLKDSAAKKISHIGQDGGVLWQDMLMDWGWYIWLDPRDGSAWTTDGDDAVHLTSTGTEVERRPLPVPSALFHGAAISPIDGSWWMMTEQAGTTTPILLHLDASGKELWCREGIGWQFALDESDGSAWTIETSYWLDPNTSTYQALSQVHHLDADGTQVLAKEFPILLSSPTVDSSDGSLWLTKTDFVTYSLLHLSSPGDVLGEVVIGSPIQAVAAIAVNSSDGSVSGTGESRDAVTGDFLGYAFRVAGTGTIAWLQGGFVIPSGMALNPVDGTVWISDSGSGSEEFSPGSAVVHLGADGSELWRSGTFDAPASVQVSRYDGSAWVSDYFDGQIVHLQGPFSPFPDMQRGNWAFDDVVACVDAGIVSGYPDGTYKPTNPVTRDQLAVYVSRALAGGDANVPTGPATAAFSDVPADYWAFRYIEYAFSQKVVEGYSDGTYKPAIAVDRAQMAVFVARAIATPSDRPDLVSYTPLATATFPDVPTSHWAYKFVEACKATEVVQGYPDGTYKPDEVVTRDQMAVYVQRAFQLPM